MCRATRTPRDLWDDHGRISGYAAALVSLKCGDQGGAVDQTRGMPLETVTFDMTSDAVEAKTWFAGLIERQPIAMSVIGSVADSLIKEPGRWEDPRWWAGRDDRGQVVAAFMHTPPHLLHIGLASAAQARSLAAQLAAEGDRLPGVGGVRKPTEAFATEWATLTGAATRTTMEIGMFDLPDRPRLPFEVPGRYRRAAGGDLALLDSWSQDFHDAVEHGSRRAGEKPPSLRPQVQAGRVAVWEHDGRAVSMAYSSWANGGVTRISGVWTPVEQRGRGYASGVVAGLSDERIGAGERCMLYTDLANPTSNAIYQALGYRRIGDSVAIEFSPVAHIVTPS